MYRSLTLGSPQHLSELYQRDAANWMRVRQTRPALNAGASGIVVGEDYSRRVLIVANPTGNNTFVNLTGQESITTGWLINQGREPVILEWERHGTLVCQAWSAGSALATTLYVLELILEHYDAGAEVEDVPDDTYTRSRLWRIIDTIRRLGGARCERDVRGR